MRCLLKDIICVHALQEQGGLCATCHGALRTGVFDNTLLCKYTGLLHCSKCHRNEKRPIPGHILFYMDVTPRFVW